ncbi:P-loop NTPase fold protein [Pseudomonas viridiflava]|uniref:P-loop NTPase fold protein n=1 Tax=Pseudomonas viridiflava TaxID=33069 RepID=UPI002EA0A2C2|nr:P-loop NTPase fold protein [Pseudomonas viridiflava]MEE3930016.1 P-loop NTPase fold protein [Pseudomonas viridiflava]MEE3940229.1 P-loop NTPase fold protein [Pseudomonas viridiflava]MEE3966253.1 P-loop NTPase fold protein [Pseudomonas viridiflava]MEE3980317.1 P-loop NTPase fold protein [Pseudomonas viridiflava]
MTIERSRKNLLQAMLHQENRVIALSGKWGTGKTHLWRQVRDESLDQAVKSAAAVSLFGVSTIADLKIKVAQALLPKLKDDNVLTAQVSVAVSGLKKLAQSVHRGFNALDDLPMLALPVLLKNRFLIIDDIERKHEKLSVDEILGFIDECVQNYNCRVLIVLNDDKLKDKAIWEQFREKVIDHELRLDTSPEEAFAIAQGIITTKWAEELRHATVTCSITNIRILCKIIRVANRLLEGHGELSKNVICRVVPPIALLSAIYYKGLPNGPTFEYVLAHNADTAAMIRALRKQRENGEESDDDMLQGQWDALLRQLGVVNSGELEGLVVDVLQTGLLDTQTISDLIERYQLDGRILTSQANVSAFFQHYNWHPDITPSHLIAELRSLLSEVEFIEAPTLSYLIDLAEELTGDQSLGHEFLTEWSAAFERTHPNGLEFSSWELSRSLRPEVEAVVQAALARNTNATTLVQACLLIRTTRGWGTAEEHLLKTISAAEYEKEIRQATGYDLEGIFYQSMQFLINKHSYASSFGDVADRFVAACQSIVAAEPDSRLTGLIRRFFKSRDKEAIL